MGAENGVYRAAGRKFALIEVHGGRLPGAEGVAAECFGAFLEPVDGGARDVNHTSQRDMADEVFRFGFRDERLDGSFQRLGEAGQAALGIIRSGPDDPWFCRAGEEADAGAVQAHDGKTDANVRDFLLKVWDVIRRDFAQELQGQVKMPGWRPTDFGGVGGVFEFVLGAF